MDFQRKGRWGFLRLSAARILKLLSYEIGMCMAQFKVKESKPSVIAINKGGTMICRIGIWILFCAVISVNAVSQINQDKDIREKVQDATTELETETLPLRFLDALTGKGIPHATVEVKDIGTYRTNAEGIMAFAPDQLNATYRVTFKAEEYITSEFSVEVQAGTIIMNRYSISPELGVRQLRVVVDWGKNPPDIDAHLVKEGGYHISFRNMHAASDGSALLDRDATNGFGPETITVLDVSSTDRYEYYIHNFSDKENVRSSRLSESHAMIKIFGEGKLMRVIEVPENAPGTKWIGFRIVNGRIIEVNAVTN